MVWVSGVQGSARLLAIGIYQVNREVPVHLCELPPALLFHFEGGPVREELFADFLRVTGRSLVFVDDDYAVVPARILARMQAGRVN